MKLETISIISIDSNPEDTKQNSPFRRRSFKIVDIDGLLLLLDDAYIYKRALLYIRQE